MCFTKTRAANRKFFNFFNNSLLIPFITRLQEKLNMTGNSNCVVTCDGEAAQIDPYFSDDVQTKLDSQGVIIAKLGASATAVSQPCDAFKMFSTTKKYLSQVTRDEVKVHVFILNAIEAMMVQYKANSGHAYQYSISKVQQGLIKCVIAVTRGMKGSSILASLG